MTAVALWPAPLGLTALLALLLAAPLLYLSVSYGYLARWHRRPVLWTTIIHENGRLTLRESLLFYDHFIGCVPTIALLALCVVGGFALTLRVPALPDPRPAGWVAGGLLGLALLLIVVTFVASVRSVGWQRTMDYALQRIERDGVLSRGGTWNMLLLSNVPIALFAIGVSSIVNHLVSGADHPQRSSLAFAGAACLSAALVLAAAITALTWCGWRRYLNLRWVAHSLRELVTYPLTAIPCALATILLVEHGLAGVQAVVPTLSALSLVTLGLCFGITVGQRALLMNENVLAMAQHPAFAPGGLSKPYLIASHVFEHCLDFVLISLLAGGTYAALRCWTLA